MSMTPVPDDPVVAAAFLNRYLQDVDRRDLRELAEYQAAFPGHEDLIAREFAALRAPADPVSRGERDIAHYELLEELGRGGQGLVYRARDRRLKRVVALKVLDRAAERSSQVMRRFRREAEVAARLDHPGICAVLDSGVAEGVTYIAMRYVEGESLAQRSARLEAADPAGREVVLQLAEFFEKAARAVHVAHQAGIVHRDIKPGNIMVTPSGEPVLLDFGLASDESDGVARLTQSGDVFGTPAYMSPEQLRGEAGSLDRRADVYSLGASLFECLTRRPPFTAATRESLYQAILHEEPRNPQALNPVLPSDLAVIVLTALEKDRDRRYQTAADLADDLRRLCNTEPIRARRVSSWVRAIRWVQRNRTVAALAALLIAVLSASLVVIYLQNVELAAELEDARTGRLSKQEREVRGMTEQGFQRLFSANPSGADALFERVLELAPRDKDALAGRYWFDSHRPTEALRVLDEYGVPGDSDVHWMRGLVLQEAGRADEAEQMFALAGQTDTDLRCYLRGLRAVNSFRSLGGEKSRAAIEQFRRAILLADAPKFHYFHSLLFAAWSCKDRAVMDEAATVLEHHWGESPATLEAIAQFYMDLDRPRARRALEQLVVVDPSAAAYTGLAHLALFDENLDAAMAYYDDGIAVEPTFAPLWYMRGQLFEKLGKVDRARSDYRRALEHGREFHLAAEAWARTHDAGDADLVVAFLAECVERVSDVPQAKAAIEKVLNEWRRK